MICFVVAEHNRHTLRWFLTTEGQELRRFVHVRSYGELFRSTKLPLGTYIFTDMEALSPTNLERAGVVWTTLEAESVHLLNHPLWSMQRFELLRALYDAGINRFDAYRVTEARTPRNFPVFLRNERDHLGPLTDLLHDAKELESAIAELVGRGLNRETLIVVEYGAQANEDGLFRKYGAFCLDGEIIPNHMIFSSHWQTKGKKRHDDEATAAEELQFVEENPHHEEIREIFVVARTQYGRIDYGFVDGQMQVYEINTNGTVMGGGRRKKKIAVDRKAKRKVLAARLIARLREMDSASPTPGPATRFVPLDPPFMGWRGRWASHLEDWYRQLDRGLPHFLRNQFGDQRW